MVLKSVLLTKLGLNLDWGKNNDGPELARASLIYCVLIDITRVEWRPKKKAKKVII